ncbi:hypothetical protein [Pseudarthrobacter sp. H2]|uniref:hypothetical protein n=1 Tax=Pseudarthrobacter sp. H2 TaxID=3418415 RepID=UPI003CF47E0B
MPWWSWIVIWIALVALSLLFFGVLGVRLFRAFMTTARELGDAAERFSRFPPGPDRPEAVDPAAAPGARPAPGSAVFASPARMRQDHHDARLARQEARRRRRVRRKADRGQPQSLRDIDFS